MRKKLPVDHVEKKAPTVNHEGEDLTQRSLFMKVLDVIIVMKQGLIDRGINGTGLPMAILGIVAKRRR